MATRRRRQAAGALRGLLHSLLLAALWIVAAGGVLLGPGLGEAKAQTTCTIDFTVPYNSPTYYHVMSTSQNADELAACDTRFPSPASGLIPNVQPFLAPGTSVEGGTYRGRTNAMDNTIEYTPLAGFAGVDSFTLNFCDQAGCGAPYRVATVLITVSPPTIVVSPSSLPAATAGVGYSQTVSATGGTGAYTFSVSSGSLPTGLVINPSSGVITGTPTAVGTFNFSVTATDTSTGIGPFSDDQAYTVVVGPPTITVSPGSISSGTEGTAYGPQTISATGGTAPYSFAVTSGSLPSGVTLSLGGVLSGTPTVNGTFGIVITATDSTTGTGAPFTDGQSYSLVIAAPPLPVANAVSATVAANSSNNAITLNITGGAASSVAVGTAPTHGSANAAGTAITYTPTAGYSGTDSFTYTATNSGGTSAPALVTITVSQPTLSLTDTLPDGYEGAGYSGSIAASLGTAPYTFAVTAGSEPSGLTLASDGTLSGTPLAGGTFTFTATATDTYGATGSRLYSVTIEAQPVAGAVSQTVAANSTDVPISLSITGGAASSVAVAGPASHGTAVASGTSITYTPTAGYSGPDSFTYTATNGAGTSTPATVTITVSAPTLTLSTPLDDGSVATPYSETVTVLLGTAPYTLSLDGGALPDGLSISGLSLSGTPTAAGSFSFTLKATDTYGAIGTQIYSLTIDPPTVSITAPATGSLGSYTAHGGTVSQTFSASGGVAPHSFAVTDGALPPGLTLSLAGALSGTPTTPGNYDFSVTASDGSGAPGPYDSSEVDYSIEVVAPTITVTPSSMSDLATAASTSTTLGASGGTAPYTFSLASGTLPTGLSLVSGGVLSGTPTVTGSYTFEIMATDDHGFTGSTTYNVDVADPAVSLDSPADGPLPPATAFVPYNATFTASGGVTPHTFHLTGLLPPGLTLAPDGTLSGTPTTPGSYSFSVTARDASPAPGPFDSPMMNYSLVVDLPLVAITTGSLPNAATGQPYSMTLAASGGTAPYSFAITAGALPAGISLSAPGVLSGTPTTEGQYNFTVEATDDNGVTGDKAFSLTVVLDTAAIRERFSTLARNFVGARHQLINRSIRLRGLGDRPGTLPGTVTMSLSDESQVMGFASSLGELRNWGAGGAAELLANGQADDQPPLEIWVDTELMLHARGDESGQFALAAVGADYRFSDSFMAGVALYGDWMNQSSADGETSGQGYLFGPYVSVALSEGVTFDASLLYGQSWNESASEMFGERFSGDFDTTRLAFKAQLEGTIELDLLTIRPRAEMFLSIEEAGDYVVRNETGTEVAVEGVLQTDYAAGLGAEFEYVYDLGDGLVLKPQLGIALGADKGANDLLAAYGTLSLGFALEDQNWGLSGTVETGADSGGLNSVGVRGDFKLRF